MNLGRSSGGFKKIFFSFPLSAAVAFSAWPCSAGAAAPTVVALGDSITEGVQSADASWSTQVLTYVTWVTFMTGGEPTVPVLAPSLFGMVGNPDGRPRIDPNAINNNVAVSGATLSSLLYSRADATSTAEIDSELDLVMYPRLQSQIEYAESVAPEIVLCWIGNNDVLSAATSFSALNATQMTSISDFDRDFTRLADRLGALVSAHGTKVVFANIPNVTDIGFLADKSIAEAMLGFPVRLGPDQFTSIIAVLLMSMDGNDNLLADPNYVLDEAEVIAVEMRIAAFNQIIDREARRIGMPVADANAKFSQIVQTPPVIGGKALRPFLMQGLFSLDGVHPNLIAHGLIANEFLTVMNQAFNMNLQLLPQGFLESLYYMDPNIDKDGDGAATGRLGAGILETLAWVLGFTGDADDFNPN